MTKWFFSGYFTKKEQETLSAYGKILESQGGLLCVRNLEGSLMQGAADFVDIEFVGFAFSFLQNMIMSGGYDLAKYHILRLWNFLQKDTREDLPFTITINGIPTVEGEETIKCKLAGNMTDEMKDKAIEQTFRLAEHICNQQYELRKRDQFYQALGGHLFLFDQDNISLSEMDVAAELKKCSKGE